MNDRATLQTLIDQAALTNSGLLLPGGRWECDGPIRLSDNP